MALPQNIFKTPKRHSRPQSAISGNRPQSAASTSSERCQPLHSTSIMPLSKSMKQTVPNRAFDMPIPMTSRSDIENQFEDKFSTNFSRDLKISLPNSSVTIRDGRSLNTSFSDFLSVSQQIPNEPSFNFKSINFEERMKNEGVQQKTAAVIVIQKYFRRYLYRKRAEARLKKLKEAQNSKKSEHSQHSQNLSLRRVLPDETDVNSAKNLNCHKMNANIQSKTIEDVIKIRKDAEDKTAKRRREKARLARVQAIEELKMERDLKKLKHETAAKKLDSARSVPDQPKKYKLTAKPMMSARFDGGHCSRKINKTSTKPVPVKLLMKSSVNSSMKSSIDVKSVLSHGKSETLDAILDSLKELEAGAEAVVTSGTNTVKNFEKVVQKVEIDDVPESSEDKASRNIDSFMCYLESVEQSSNVALPSPTETTQEVAKPIQNIQQITSSVLSKNLQLGEAKQAIQILETSLEKQKQLSVHQLKHTELELNTKNQNQKSHYESTIARHLTFIDQLITDKKQLQERCEEVAKKSKSGSDSLNSLIDKERKKHNEQILQLKEHYLTAEKIRREKWMDEQTKIIKKSTVNALEPEIQRLMNAHKQELSRVKTLHEADLLESDEKAGRKYVEQMAKLRKDLENERDDLVERERANASNRYDKQLEQEEKAFQAQKRRLYQEIAEEKERLFHQSNRLKKENDDFKNQLEQHQSASAKALQNEFDRAKSLAENRHLKEIENLKAQFDSEKELWKNNIEKNYELKISEKEKNIFEMSKVTRDREIKMVLERLELEHSETRQTDSQAVENRIRRVREKYESELKEVERSERLTQQRYIEIKQKLVAETESRMNLDREMNQVNDDFVSVKSRLDRLIGEKDQVRDIVRDEFSDRLVLLEDENARLKRESSESRARHRLEIQNGKSRHDEELKAIQDRVKQAISRKEESVKSIKRQQEMAENRAKHLEELLEESRKVILKS